MARTAYQQTKSPSLRLKLRSRRNSHTRGWMRRLERELHVKQARKKKEI